MAVTGTKTVRDIVTAALRKAGVTDWSQEPEADEAAVAMSELNLMLKAWQTRGYSLWLASRQSLVPVQGQFQYDLTVVRPLRILSARWKNASGVDLPMRRMTRLEQNELPIKDVQGIPTSFYYDRQREAAKFFIWPAPGPVTTETIRIDYEREQEDIAALGDTLDLPGEWWEAAVYNLADRMLDTWGQQRPMVTAKAQEYLRLALAHDREDSVTFEAELD